MNLSTPLRSEHTLALTKRAPDVYKMSYLRRYSVNATYLRRYSVNATLYKRHVPAWNSNKPTDSCYCDRRQQENKPVAVMCKTDKLKGKICLQKQKKIPNSILHNL